LTNTEDVVSLSSALAFFNHCVTRDAAEMDWEEEEYDEDWWTFDDDIYEDEAEDPTYEPDHAIGWRQRDFGDILRVVRRKLTF